jgi:16S rRNA (guanine966-N2)-methyltransferase
MRITSGIYKNRILKMPKGIRPTQEKVRKAVFDISGDIEGLSFLELFAGSGAVGFEALSRGAKEIVFVENDRLCVKAIKENILLLGYPEASVIAQEAGKAIEHLHRNRKKFDIIFLDPPYYQNFVLRPHDKFNKGGLGSKSSLQEQSLSKKILQMLEAYDILAHYGFIVIQHYKKDNLPDALEDLKLFKQARYGDTVLSFYRRLSAKHVPNRHLSR